MRQFLEELQEINLSETVAYTDGEGRLWSYALWQLILHLTDHRTYHRGQVSLLLRQLGVAPPATGLLNFYAKVSSAGQ